MAISSTGVGSGLQVDSIISQLTAVERRPIAKLQTQASSIQTKISSYGKIRSLVNELNSAARTLTLDRSWNATKISSSTSNVAAASTGIPVAGNYNVDVKALASGQTMASKETFSASDVMGTDGKLKINGGNLGTTGYEVNISSMMSLTQIVGAINQTEGLSDKVQASIVATDDGTQRLVLRSRGTGSDTNFNVSVTDSAGADATALPTKLAKLAQGFDVTQSASNARLSFNGVEISSKTNVFDSAIPGMTVTASAVGTSVISVSADKDAVRNNIKKFVDAYNSLNSFLSESTKFEQGTGGKANTVGPLQGDTVTVNLQNSLRMVTQSSIQGDQGAMRRLSDLGIQMQRGGTLSIDESKLTAALNRPEEAKAVFNQAASIGHGGGIATRFKSLTDRMMALNGDLDKRTDALNATLERNSRAQAAIEARATALGERMRKQYSALDVKMSKINGMNSYVTGMVNALNAAANRK